MTLYYSISAPIEYWKQKGHDEIKEAISNQRLNTNRAKNIIIFIGDGMDLPTVATARILKGQLEGREGEEDQLCFEEFPHVGFSKVGLIFTLVVMFLVCFFSGV